MAGKKLTLRKRKLIADAKNILAETYHAAFEASLSLLARKPQARLIEKPNKASAADSVAFTCSLVALHAQLAKFKGSLSADAFLEFRCVFPVGDMESQNLRDLFAMAWEDDETIESHIARMVSAYPGRTDLYVKSLEGLARHMLADGAPSRPQLSWLNHAAMQFGIPRLQMRHIIHQAEKPLEARPHALLEISKRATIIEIKHAYKTFMKRCHPDIAASAKLPETKLASERLSRAGNLAYKRLQK